MFAHLNQKQLGYFTHLCVAWNISIRLGYAAIAVFIHGIYPDIFTDTASGIIRDIIKEIKVELR